MLGVVLPDGPLTAQFQDFLGEQTEYKVVSADQWLGIYRFSQEARAARANPRPRSDGFIGTLCALAYADPAAVTQKHMSLHGARSPVSQECLDAVRKTACCHICQC